MLTPAYIALRNMYATLKYPTMIGYPEIATIRDIMEEALQEWKKDKLSITSLQEQIKEKDKT